MSNHIELSIIIVSYNTKELTLQCLTSIGKPPPTWEILVVDNGSTDGTVEYVSAHIPYVQIIGSKKNLGFSGGNNLGIKKSKGGYVLLLNSDTKATTHAIGSMVEFMQTHPEAGVATCKLILANGSMDPACHRGFPTPWAALTYFTGLERLFPSSRLFGQYHMGWKGNDTLHEIDSPAGAFFLVRREVIDTVGLLDEEFFMYGEDIDWAYRMKRAGYKIFFNPEVSIVHLKKQSGREGSNESVRKRTQYYFYSTMKLFYEKHYRRKYPAVFTTLVNIGLGLLMVLSKL